MISQKLRVVEPVVYAVDSCGVFQIGTRHLQNVGISAGYSKSGLTAELSG